MRTTINIRDEALELCRKRSEQAGTSLGEVVSEAIIEAYRERPQERQGRIRYDLPAFGEGGLQPGADLDDSAALEDVMEGRG